MRFFQKPRKGSDEKKIMDDSNIEKGSETQAPEQSHSTSYRNDAEENTSQAKEHPTRWAMGILNDRETHEVPGSVLMLADNRNAPLGLNNAPATSSSTSLPPQSPIRTTFGHTTNRGGQKTTSDGAIILNPQPDESHNDPLNWPSWRRDLALLSLGLYCMLGGGMTPILAAGFSNVGETYHVSTPKVARTTGLFMMGLGVGGVFVSPLAILYGKRPVYLVSAIIFIATDIWCAASPSYNSLLVARIIQGMSLSPVECLPSATIAEIFFLHERAFRIGIYTLLLLGGKNLVPLVSAAIIQSLSWRWVFWIVAIIAGFCWALLFIFVPETFWDRTPRPKSHGPSRNRSVVSLFRRSSHTYTGPKAEQHQNNDTAAEGADDRPLEEVKSQDNLKRRGLTSYNSDGTVRHVGFAHGGSEATKEMQDVPERGPTPHLDRLAIPKIDRHVPASAEHSPTTPSAPTPNDVAAALGNSAPKRPGPTRYTSELKQRPKLSFMQQLKPFNGRLTHDKWFRVAMRPFILYAYPAVLWSAIVYACSIGWLIVLSESIAEVFRSKETYNFSALSAGLIYISPFIGGILGTAVAGRLSDVIVKAMSRRNGGLYEPEFRLVMAIPVAITTVIGLMGFGWSAQDHDAWIVPTIFFGCISFGCSLGSTTAITFCVDSYRVYAGEALVTLNFSKNIFHGLVFSLFFNSWLSADGSKMVFIWLGVIQLLCLSLTIPMYIFGKRARMWTARKNLMGKF